MSGEEEFPSSKQHTTSDAVEEFLRGHMAKLEEDREVPKYSFDQLQFLISDSLKSAHSGIDKPKDWNFLHPREAVIELNSLLLSELTRPEQKIHIIQALVKIGVSADMIETRAGAAYALGHTAKQFISQPFNESNRSVVENSITGLFKIMRDQNHEYHSDSFLPATTAAAKSLLGIFEGKKEHDWLPAIQDAYWQFFQPENINAIRNALGQKMGLNGNMESFYGVKFKIDPVIPKAPRGPL